MKNELLKWNGGNMKPNVGGSIIGLFIRSIEGLRAPIVVTGAGTALIASFLISYLVYFSTTCPFRLVILLLLILRTELNDFRHRGQFFFPF